MKDMYDRSKEEHVIATNKLTRDNNQLREQNIKLHNELDLIKKNHANNEHLL